MIFGKGAAGRIVTRHIHSAGFTELARNVRCVYQKVKQSIGIFKIKEQRALYISEGRKEIGTMYVSEFAEWSTL